MITKQQSRLPQQNTFYFDYQHQIENTHHKVTFDSKFDSGNLQDVIQISYNTVSQPCIYVYVNLSCSISLLYIPHMIVLVREMKDIQKAGSISQLKASQKTLKSRLL